MKRIFLVLSAMAAPGLALACGPDETCFSCTTEGGAKPVRLCAPAEGPVEFWLGERVWLTDLASLRPEITEDGAAVTRSVAFSEENGNQSLRVWSAGAPDGAGAGVATGGYEITAGAAALEALSCDPGSLSEDLAGLAGLVDIAQISP